MPVTWQFSSESLQSPGKSQPAVALSLFPSSLGWQRLYPHTTLLKAQQVSHPTHGDAVVHDMDPASTYLELPAIGGHR